MIDERVLGTKLDKVIYMAINGMCFFCAAFFTVLIIMEGGRDTIDDNPIAKLLLMGTLLCAGILCTAYVVRWEIIKLTMANDARGLVSNDR